MLLRAVVKLVSWDPEQPKYSGASLGSLLTVTNVGHPVSGWGLEPQALGSGVAALMPPTVVDEDPGPAAGPREPFLSLAPSSPVLSPATSSLSPQER